MEKESEVIKQRKDKLKDWLNNHIGIVLVILVAFIIRIYYLNLTGGQPLWWDEAEYMATAKHWALGVPYDVNIQRPPLFQLLASFLLTLGLAEQALKFLLVLIPSTLSILVIYLLGKELFDKRIALMAASASVFIWPFLFWTARFQPDFFSLGFQLLSILFFWKLFKTNKTSHAVYAGLFTAIAFYFKISALLVPLSILIFVLFKDGFSFIKNKNYWISFVSFIIALIPFAIWQYIMFGNPFAFAPSYIEGTGIGQGWEFGWMVLKFFYVFPKSLFFILFLLGIILVTFKILISFDLILKEKSKRFNAHIFSLIFLLVTTLFYIFYIRGTIEDRWVFLIIPFILFFSSYSLSFIYDASKKYNKIAASVVIILLFSVFIYYQMQHSDALIKVKKDSYLPVKESSLWIKEHSNPEDKILSNSYTQATTYSEREVIPYPALVKNESEVYSFIPSKKEMMVKILEEKKPKYLVVSAFENHPDWTNEWLSENQKILKPVQAYFADVEKKQPVLIVYEINYA